ncbi:uncharacterized protein LOC128673887 isoform X1 [Plodia interpunctella]|uniref:uncharacterized protein LOC128673887 isoform X1 n=1 Tax=Plodia interpunctella TaxID=58824 RepID=UPI002368E1D1|nr:uncharacterized protein LOC128673887 isoform X1 [Plodia interpunctella]
MLIPTCLIKFMELSLTIACLTLHHYSYDLTDLPTLMLCSGTYVGFIVVLSGEIIGETISAAADPYITSWWAAAGAMLFGACGALTLNAWKDIPKSDRHMFAQILAVCSLAAAAVFAIDSLISICNGRKYSDDSVKPEPCGGGARVYQ